jgi:ankyrin repeat protein
LSYAAWWGRVEIAKLLIDKGAEVNPKDKKQLSNLSAAVASGNDEMVKLLLNSGATISDPHLDEAAANGNTEMVRALLAKGANIESVTSAVQVLVAAGADVAARDNEGRSALQIATSVDRKEVAQFLQHLDQR